MQRREETDGTCLTQRGSARRLSEEHHACHLQWPSGGAMPACEGAPPHLGDSGGDGGGDAGGDVAGDKKGDGGGVVRGALSS